MVILKSFGEREVNRGERVVGSVLMMLFFGVLLCIWLVLGRFFKRVNILFSSVMMNLLKFVVEECKMLVLFLLLSFFL